MTFVAQLVRKNLEWEGLGRDSPEVEIIAVG